MDPKQFASTSAGANILRASSMQANSKNIRATQHQLETQLAQTQEQLEQSNSELLLVSQQLANEKAAHSATRSQLQHLQDANEIYQCQFEEQTEQNDHLQSQLDFKSMQMQAVVRAHRATQEELQEIATKLPLAEKSRENLSKQVHSNRSSTASSKSGFSSDISAIPSGTAGFLAMVCKAAHVDVPAAIPHLNPSFTPEFITWLVLASMQLTAMGITLLMVLIAAMCAAVPVLILLGWSATVDLAQWLLQELLTFWKGSTIHRPPGHIPFNSSTGLLTGRPNSIRGKTDDARVQQLEGAEVDEEPINSARTTSPDPYETAGRATRDCVTPTTPSADNNCNNTTQLYATVPDSDISTVARPVTPTSALPATPDAAIQDNLHTPASAADASVIIRGSTPDEAADEFVGDDHEVADVCSTDGLSVTTWYRAVSDDDAESSVCTPVCEDILALAVFKRALAEHCAKVTNSQAVATTNMSAVGSTQPASVTTGLYTAATGDNRSVTGQRVIGYNGHTSAATSPSRSVSLGGHCSGAADTVMMQLSLPGRNCLKSYKSHLCHVNP